MGTSRPTFLTPFKLALVAIALSLGIAAQAQAAGTHPVTGEALADDQTFTYRLLDQFPTLDPQLNQDVSGFHVIRDLFEGLLSQDGDGNLVPGVATQLRGVGQQHDLYVHAAPGCQVVERRSRDCA